LIDYVHQEYWLSDGNALVLIQDQSVTTTKRNRQLSRSTTIHV